MANVLIGFPNYADDGSLSGGSWTNRGYMQNPLLAAVARSNDATASSTIINVDLGSARPIRAVALVRNNLTRNATVQVLASEDNYFSYVYDSGEALAWGTLEEGDTPYDAVDFVAVIPSVAARYWRIMIEDTANPDGCVEIGRLYMTNGWQPSINMEYGAQLGWETDTVKNRSIGGVDHATRHSIRRVATLRITGIPEDEGLRYPFEMQRYMGTDKQVMFVFDPDDTEHLIRRSFLATLQELSPLEYPFYDANSVALAFTEVL